MHAAFRGHVTCLELLIESGAQVDPEVTICEKPMMSLGMIGGRGVVVVEGIDEVLGG